MQRFFVDPHTIKEEAIVLDAHISRQLCAVLRADTGTEIILLDDLGNAYLATIESCSQKRTTCRITKVWQPDTEPHTQITLYQAVPKNQRLDMVLQKGTELGVTTFVPLICEHSVVRLGTETGKLTRWRRIAREAAEQCGRARIPKVLPPCTFEQALSGNQENAQMLVPCLSSSASPFSEITLSSELHILIGPEGGFSPRETRLAEKEGAVLVSLGKRVLRSETAGIIASALALYKCGDLE